MMGMKLYVAWRDPEMRSWYPVGILTIDEEGLYNFVYTKGARENMAFWRMKIEDSVYQSEELFPWLSNRMISPERPEYKDHLRWLDLDSSDSLSPLRMLAITEGIKVTDNLEFFECPSMREDGEYRSVFLVHGMRYLSKAIADRVNKLRKGEQLFLMPDIQNEWDVYAMALRTGDPVSMIGYCPRYLSPDIHDLVERNGSVNVRVSVKRVNADAPVNLRLVCELTTPWPDGFSPCDRAEFEPAVSASGSWGTGNLNGDQNGIIGLRSPIM